MARVTGYGGKPPGKHGYGDGLILMVSPKGTSTWYARLSVGGRETLRKLGRANTRLNSTQAARMCADMKEQAKAGEIMLRTDAAAHNGRQLNRQLLGGFLTVWAAAKLKGENPKWTVRHHDKTLERLEKHLAPLWESPVIDLKRPEIIKHLETIDSVDTAGRVFAWLKEALEDGVDKGTLDYSVLGRKPGSLTLSKKHRNTRPSYGADLDKLADLYRAIRTSDHARSVRLAGQLALLTGLRLGEVIELRAEYYDAAQRALVIPREKMKEKDHWRGDFTVPLAPATQRVVEQALETTVDGWLLPGPRTGRPLRHEGVEKMFQRLTDRQHTPHGTRTSLRTWALEKQEAPEMIANSLIDHATSKGANAHYDQTQFIPQRRALLKAWAEVLTNG